MLAQTTAAEALGVLLRADLAGAHSYLILDAEGRGYCVEAMPSARPVQTLAADPLVHTNHVTEPAALPFEGEQDSELVANSRRRLDLAAAMLADDSHPVDADRLMEITREPSAICRWPDAKYRVESSGAGHHAAPHRRLLGLLGPARRSTATSTSPWRPPRSAMSEAAADPPRIGSRTRPMGGKTLPNPPGRHARAHTHRPWAI